MSWCDGNFGKTLLIGFTFTEEDLLQKGGKEEENTIKNK